MPTVLAGGQISMRVRPEVSDGIRIPGLTVRRAETTIELASGQSFAMAGLLHAEEAARTAHLDLDDAGVRANLAFYDTVRPMATR